MGHCTLNTYVNVHFFYMHIGCAKESTLKYLINLYCIVSAIWSIKQMISFIHILKIFLFFNNFFNYQNSDTNPSQGSGPRGILLCDIKIKNFIQKITTKKPFISKVFYFSIAIFNQSVLPTAELDSTAPIYF